MMTKYKIKRRFTPSLLKISARRLLEMPAW